MSIPTVSVIMPAFNAEEYISDAIESVLSQTFSNLELIVVDNMSLDRTRRVAEGVVDSRLRVAECRSRGAAAARNVGMQLARGQHFQFLDADDQLAPEKIEAQLAVLGDSPDETIASCGWGRFQERPENAKFIPQVVWKDYPRAWEWLLDSWSGGGMMQTACWLVPRTIIEEAGPWDESLVSNPNDDGEFFCRVLLKSRSIAFCAVNGVFYRSSIPDSLSRRVDRDAVESAFRTCELYETHIENAGLGENFRFALRRNYLQFMYQYYPSRKDLMKKAWRGAKRLAAGEPMAVGGARFRMVAQALGFTNALRLRQLANSIISSD